MWYYTLQLTASCAIRANENGGETTKCFQLTIIALCLASPLVVIAETLEIPLGLTAPSDSYTVLTEDFTLAIPPDAIIGLSVRIAGTHVDQFYICSYVPYESRVRGAQFEIRFGDDAVNLPSLGALYSLPMVGSATESQPFEALVIPPPSSYPDPLGFLSDGVGQVGLRCRPKSVPHWGTTPCEPSNVPLVSVTEFVLVVTYDPAVATVDRNWGSLKARYP